MKEVVKKSLFLIISISMFTSSSFAIASGTTSSDTASSRQLENPLGRVIGMMITKQPAQKLCGPAEKSVWTLRVADGNIVYTMPFGKFLAVFGKIVCEPLNIDGYSTSSFAEKTHQILQNQDEKTVLLSEFSKLPNGAKAVFCKNGEFFSANLWNVLKNVCS